jgi:hypothetical protein
MLKKFYLYTKFNVSVNFSFLFFLLHYLSFLCTTYDVEDKSSIEIGSNTIEII